MFTNQHLWFKGTKLEIIPWNMQLYENNHYLYIADQMVLPFFDQYLFTTIFLENSQAIGQWKFAPWHFTIAVPEAFVLTAGL